MDIDNFTTGQIKDDSKFLNPEIKSQKGLNFFIDKKVIVRTYSAGVFFGTVDQKDGDEVILRNARRLRTFKCLNGSIATDGLAVFGLDKSKSQVGETIEYQWIKAIEIKSMTNQAIKTIEDAESVQAS